MDRETIFLGGMILAGAVVLGLFRTMAISRLAQRMTALMSWEFDSGVRYGWLVIGPTYFGMLGRQNGVDIAFMMLAVAWLLGLGAIWYAPEMIVRQFKWGPHEPQE